MSMCELHYCCTRDTTLYNTRYTPIQHEIPLSFRRTSLVQCVLVTNLHYKHTLYSPLLTTRYSADAQCQLD